MHYGLDEWWLEKFRRVRHHGPRENSRVRMKACRVVISMTDGSLCFITQECTVCNHRRDRDAGEAKRRNSGFRSTCTALDRADVLY